jgi:hypothetical protein
VTDSRLAANLSDVRCATCGYGITVRADLPACPMCQTTDWRTRYELNREERRWPQLMKPVTKTTAPLTAPRES